MIRELCIPVLALKCHWRFLPDFFCWSFMKNQEQIKKRRPHCDTQLKTLKISYSFFTEGSWKSSSSFCWSFIKSQEINQFERSTLYHSLGIKMPPMISSFYWRFMKSQKTEATKSMMSKFLIALIVIRNLAFYFVIGIYEIWRHEDTKIWCQNFLLLSLW